MHACAVATRRQLAHVRVLAESFAGHHPGSPFTVLVIDGMPEEAFDEGAPYQAIDPTAAGIGGDELRRLALVHEATALDAALRPRLVAHLLAEGDDVVVLLEPDMVVHGDLAAVEPLARDHGVVLVPHVLGPVPDDGFTPDAGAVAALGPFHPGLVAAAPGGAAAVAAWGDGLDLGHVAARFDHAVWRDPRVGVAYWNLHERPLTGEALPLILQLRGHRVDRPHLLSELAGSTPRVLLSEEPVLAALVADYAHRLRAAGVERWSQVPYRYGTIAGTPVPPVVRRIAADALAHRPDDPPPAPFAGPDSDAAFIEWLNRPVARSTDRVVTRLVLGVWHHRGDLQAVFPHPLFGDLDGLAHWSTEAADFAREYGRLHAPPAIPAPPEPVPAPPGLNIVGYLRAELGVGEAGRLMALAADAGGVPHQTIATSDTPSRQLDPFLDDRAAVPPPVPYRVSLLCVNADRTPHLLAELDPAVLAGRYRIGLWFWELSRPAPDAEGALALVDEVWVASDFVAEPLRGLTDKPVLVTPLAIAPPPPTHLSRADLRLPEDRCIFLSTFDAFSIPARKNPAGVIAAYRSAFGSDDGAHLVVKATNGHRHRAALEELRHLARGRPDIEIRDGYLSRLEMAALVRLSDACVSLHRSEGFGLVPAAAMAAGKPVVATAYSGTLAFMDDDSALLVPYELVDVGPGNAPYPPDAQWAEPDLDVAAKHLRIILDDPEAARRLGARAQEAVARTHGIDVAGEWIRRRLDEIVRGRPRSSA